jgi:hypothetical protein
MGFRCHVSGIGVRIGKGSGKRECVDLLWFGYMYVAVFTTTYKGI